MDLEYHFASEEERKLFPRKPIYEDGWKYEFFMTLAWNDVISIYPNKGIIRNNTTGKIYDRVTNTGYIDIPIKYNGIIIHGLAHRIIWWSINGPIDNKLFINHINGIKTDNRLVNLEVVTNQENIQHAWSIGLCDQAVASQKAKEYFNKNIHTRAQFTKEQIFKIISQYKYDQMSIREIARQLNVHHSIISDIVHGKTYKPWTKDIL